MIKVLTVRDMLSHVCRRGHLTLRGVPYRWVEGLSPWHLHCSCHGRTLQQPAGHTKWAGSYMHIAGVVQDIVNKNARSQRV
jgi:hypothetical protein